MNINLRLQPGQTKTITLSPIPGLPEGHVPLWTRIAGTTEFGIGPGNMSATVSPTAGDLGRTIFAVTVDAGENIIGFIVGVEVIPTEATSLNPTVS